MHVPARDERIDTVVIGAGQAGLSTGYHLRRTGRDFVIVDADARVGDVWRRRWDSLRLFTPAAYSSLPGLPFPADRWHLPAKDEVADYLEAYSDRFALPVRPHTRVTGVHPAGEGHVVETSTGRIAARHVVVATGAFQRPHVPPFARSVDPAIRQLHSSEYRNPAQLPPGPALVVGAGNSGSQIAAELAETRPVWLSGPDTGRVPRSLLGRDIYWWIWRPILSTTVDSRRGRRLKARRFFRGDPVIGLPPEALALPALRRVGRTTGVRDGRPTLEDGRTLDVASVVWCTGFRPDFGWIDAPILGPDGYPRHTRGVADEAAGLYFVGLRFLYRLRSSLIGGVGEDAAHVAAAIAASSASRGGHVPTPRSWDPPR